MASLNELHQLYNLYFQGVERQQPHLKRKTVDEKLEWLRQEVVKKNNAALNFQIRQVEARYQMFRNRWDKTLAEIEAGTFRIPVQRKR